jgi:hypothetical protein
MNWLRLGYLGATCSLVLGCSGDASLGHGSLSNNFTGGGTMSAAAGSGNNPGTAGSGAPTMSGGSANGGSASGGTDAGGGALSGAGPQAGEGSSGGETSFDDSPVNLDAALTDRKTPGTGACTTSTLDDVLKAIAQQLPALADITRLYSPDLGGDGNLIYAFAKPDGFRVVVKRGSGDCPAGCIDNEYWYFETTADCQVAQRGHYTRAFNSSGNCYQLTDAPLWGLPPTTSAGICPSTDLSALNTACVNDACPSGLTPVKFYGVAGTAGPQFCSCSIPCAVDAEICPTGTSCTYIGDGPGQVCYK